MSDLVSANKIEAIVGTRRHAVEHYGRAVSSEQTVYVLHSQQCKDSTPDLRDCPYSVMLDKLSTRSSAWKDWRQVLDTPIRLEIVNGELWPDLAGRDHTGCTCTRCIACACSWAQITVGHLCDLKGSES